MFEVINVIAIVISFVSLIISLFAYFITKENLSLNAFMNALEVWGSDEAREARRYVHKNFPDYTVEGDKDGIEVKLQVKNGEYSGLATIKVRVLNDEDRKYFEKVAVLTDRVGFMLFEMKRLPKEFKKAYLGWLHETFCSVWNKVAPHVDMERKNRRANFTPYFEKIAYLSHIIALRQKRGSKIILLDSKKMEDVFQEYKKLWDC
ncbi:MAG: hypothetical protein QXO67_01365 [Candidatus Bathyarchaeia archaeon]